MKQMQPRMEVGSDSGVLMPIRSQESDYDSTSSVGVGRVGDMLGECKCLVDNLPSGPSVVVRCYSEETF